MKESATELKLPHFDVPELPSKPLTPEAYRAWIRENLSRYRNTTDLTKILADPLRRPVDVRFSLSV